MTSAGSFSHTACLLKVRDSLPSVLGQHMDTGRIRVDVTNITNGSVVVEFSLLIMADLNVTEVSAAFLGALQNTSLLEVVRDKTFIRGTQGLGWTLVCASHKVSCGPGLARRALSLLVGILRSCVRCRANGGSLSFLLLPQLLLKIGWLNLLSLMGVPPLSPGAENKWVLLGSQTVQEASTESLARVVKRAGRGRQF